MNVFKLLENQSKSYGSKPALIFKDQTISFVELQKNVKKFAAILDSLGVRGSEKVAFYLPNCPEYVYSYLAVFCQGAVGVPLDIMLKTDELISCLSHAEVKILIALPKPDIEWAEINKAVPTLERIVFLGETVMAGLSQTVLLGELLKAVQPEIKERPVNPSDPALIMYTSGTTGQPKGILLNYRHLDGSPKAMEYFVDLKDSDVKLCPLPLSHIGGFIYIQNCLLFGITLVLMDRFNPYEFIKLIQDYKVTCFHIVPAMYTAVLSLKQIEKFDLSSLRWVVVFGAPSTPEIMERFHQYCPNAQLLNGWGMTETCPPNTVTPFGSKNIASVGKPAPHCEMAVVDEAGQPLLPGHVGEVVIRGWVVMAEYYKDPVATAEVLRNGWLYTGDLGRFDQEGFLYIVGRKKEMIKVGGQIVYAPEVEAAFYKNEDIAEVAVIGVPDSLRGEAVKAFVVLHEGRTTTAEDLRYFAREHLAHFKVPHTIEIRQALPKNRIGKIDKEKLKMENDPSPVSRNS